MQLDDGLDVVCLRKEVDGRHGDWMIPGRGQLFQIAGKRRRVARNVDDLGGGKGDDPFDDHPTGPSAGRVEKEKIGVLPSTGSLA